MSLLLQPPDIEKEQDKYSIHVFDRIEEVDAAVWDSIIGPDDLQATHSFIRTCQSAAVEQASYRHLMIYEGDRLVSVASLSLMPVSLDLLSSGIPRKIIRLLRRLRPDFLRIQLLLCGLPVSFGNSCIRFRAGADTRRILEMINGAMESVAQELNVSVLCFKEFTNDEAAALDDLTRFDYFRAESLPGCSMKIVWPTFDDYLTSMRAGYRRQLTTSLRRRQEAGLKVRVLDGFGAECESIHRLYEAVMERAEFQLERLNLSFFEKLNADFGAQSRAILLERNGELLAAAIMLVTNRVATFLLAGIDYEQNRLYHSYFNLVIEVVRQAINTGAETLVLGQTSYDLKTRLGGITDARCLYLKHRNKRLNSILRAASKLLFPSVKISGRRVFKTAAGFAPKAQTSNDFYIERNF